MRITGNTVLITGGATGIGLALAGILVAEGNTVVICGRRRSALRAAKQRIPHLHTRVCDVSKPVSRRALLRWLGQNFKKLDILINNAGVQHPVDFLKGPRDLREADEEILTNLVAPVHLTALLIPSLKRKQCAAVVNISSGLGFTPLASVPVYSATKAAIHSLTMSLRHQLRGTPVRVFEMIPPIVTTELHGTRRRPQQNEYTMSPEEVASGIVKALAEDRYELALGAAANLHAQRDRLFEMINGG